MIRFGILAPKLDPEIDRVDYRANPTSYETMKVSTHVMASEHGSLKGNRWSDG